MAGEERVAPVTGRRELNTSLMVQQVTDRVEVLCLSGVLDTEGAAALGRELAGRLGSTPPERRLILDLTGLRLLSAAGIQVLDTHTRHLSHRPVFVVVAAPHAREIFSIAPAPGLRVCATLDAALASLPDVALPTAVEATDTSEVLSEEVLGLRAKARTGAVIGMAQGILLERYGLVDSQAAFDLLRQASQHHNVPLRVLASAVVTAPAPTAPSAEWFPGRLPAPPPSSNLLAMGDQQALDRGQLLRALVYEVVTVADADAAEIHLVDPAMHNSLVLEAHSGLDAAYRDRVAQVNDPRTVPGRARLRGEPVQVADVLTDPALVASDEGRMLPATGSRSLCSVPALSEDGECVGTITVHNTRPGTWLTQVQVSALRTLAEDLAAWHSWYRRTVVLDALEYVHAHGQTARAS
ncbi:ANTAR domain-containing protein [Streptomyces aureus]|uniref:ANTAR domain-containing protein n=1 Tax=Streptomyces aureus TaxID=193461 RepID=UPI00068B3739|nr:ANTAR domain-containing protein [Streptomyces aureus]